jgi:hypothetical protein
VDKILDKAVKDKLIEIDSQGVFRITNNESYDKLLSYLELKDKFEFSV